MAQKSLHIVNSMLRLHRVNIWDLNSGEPDSKIHAFPQSSLPTFFTFNILVVGAQEPVSWYLNSVVRRKPWSSNLSPNIQINSNFSKLLDGSNDSMWKTLSTETLTQ